MKKSEFVECKFKEVIFLKSDLKKVEFKSCSFEDTQFKYIDLEDQDFEGCSFKNVNFDKAYLKEASFKNATLQNVSFIPENPLTNKYHKMIKSIDFEGACIDKVTYNYLKGFGIELSGVKII